MNVQNRKKLLILVLIFRYMLFLFIFYKGSTDFGISIDKLKMNDLFRNDPKESKIFLDYNIFDTEYD